MGWTPKRTRDDIAMEPCYLVRRVALQASVKDSRTWTGVARAVVPRIAGRWAACAMGLPSAYMGRVLLCGRRFRHETHPHPPGGGTLLETMWRCGPVLAAVSLDHGVRLESTWRRELMSAVVSLSHGVRPESTCHYKPMSDADYPRHGALQSEHVDVNPCRLSA